jgi:energy-coupling factor transporter transmembrane protein EcfT
MPNSGTGAPGVPPSGNFNPVQLHPATKITLWLLFAVSLPWQHPASLLSINVLLLILFAVRRPSGLFRLLRRTRWLLLSLLLIYALATPGEVLWPQLPPYLAPTREGVAAGLIQVWRLGTLLVGLAWLLAACTRNELLAGLYVLLRPFKALGFNAERVAVRVWLTLHYAEQTELGRFEDWRERFREALSPALASTDRVVLELGTFGWRDIVALMVACLALAGLWLS